MGRSFIHFNRRDVKLRFPSDPNDPWYSEFQRPSDGFDRPRYHVTRAVHGPASQVERGDTVWLVGQLYTPWGEILPATLDARIDVADIGLPENGVGYRYTAASSSRWFPLARSTECLQHLETAKGRSTKNKIWENPSRPIGHYLQRMRVLKNDDYLRMWETALESKSLHFVSYRIRDGSYAAFELVKDLLSRDVAIFWDRWSLPRRLAERREAVGDEPLNEAIMSAIHSVEAVWGVESPLYGAKNSYSLRERALALALGKYHPLPVISIPPNKALHLDLS